MFKKRKESAVVAGQDSVVVLQLGLLKDLGLVSDWEAFYTGSRLGLRLAGFGIFDLDSL